MSYSCKRKEMPAARLENVTQTIAKILQGYDIRLRPNFGGETMNGTQTIRKHIKKIQIFSFHGDASFLPSFVALHHIHNTRIQIHSPVQEIRCLLEWI